MVAIATIGLDLAKSVFQVHAVDAAGNIVTRRAIRRSQLLDFFERTPPCLVGMEACASAHYWTREFGKLGHRVRIMPASYVKAYVKRNKTDAADAEAICEAVTRPTMRFVPVKSDVEQSVNMMLKARDLLTRQRTQTVNALRSHLVEMGIVAGARFKASAKLIEIVRDDTDHRLPPIARFALIEIADQIERLTEKIMKLENVIVSSVREDDVSRRLTSIPGVGPITAAAVRALVPDPAGFDIEAGQSSTAKSLHGGRHGDPQNVKIRSDYAALGRQPSEAEALQGRRCGHGQQDSPYHLGFDDQRRMLRTDIESVARVIFLRNSGAIAPE